MGGRGFESRQKRPKLKDENFSILGDALINQNQHYLSRHPCYTTLLGKLKTKKKLEENQRKP